MKEFIPHSLIISGNNSNIFATFHTVIVIGFHFFEIQYVWWVPRDTVKNGQMGATTIIYISNRGAYGP